MVILARNSTLMLKIIVLKSIEVRKFQNSCYLPLIYTNFPSQNWKSFALFRKFYLKMQKNNAAFCEKNHIFGPFNTGPFYAGPYNAAREKITPFRAGVIRADKVYQNTGSVLNKISWFFPGFSNIVFFLSVDMFSLPGKTFGILKKLFSLPRKTIGI